MQNFKGIQGILRIVALIGLLLAVVTFFVQSLRQFLPVAIVLAGVAGIAGQLVNRTPRPH
ncbi:hypothetical protein [Schleiferilactobacillus shenzhenensis]|uniref:Uncharacterized protein n=1 Tax=Schleiferilactobacillus shenzhenensis LY-73 TaxID=1231336 RepID=U4TU42_9LACO|nr:hypothetical protein [Schleiferilactobacillus shenzhenensis]ERL65388.1 hypothetical protein L248_2787 [Schleiferilactobacillus shenzhenensis LY-73]